MKFYCFGNQTDPVILLLPGTCCHWKRNFGPVIPLLERDFYVVCVSYDGFDETEDGAFRDMLTETAGIEAYVREHFGGHIHAAYGCSLGGSFVGLLIERGIIRIDHGILGSSDLDQEGGLSAWLKAELIAGVLCGILRRGRLPGWMRRRLDRKSREEREYLELMLNMFGIGGDGMPFVKQRSIRRQFYSDLTTPLGDNISAPGTKIHIFYAAKMGGQYEERYLKHFKDPDIRRYDMQHEELLVRCPKKWAEEVRSCCRIKE